MANVEEAFEREQPEGREEHEVNPVTTSVPGATILVTYSSKHGATGEIAERIADRLRSAGLEVEVRPIGSTGDLSTYAAFIVGSAVYFESWMKDAIAFVQRNQAMLSDRLVWLFSSGPLGASPTDDEGRDLREVAEPKQLAELREMIAPRDHRVFFGVLDPGTLGFSERALRKLPAGRTLLPEGDFRDWQEIEGWADGIADELVASRHAARQPVS
jgi:menaquinone-dependent protoporphyrinogen oxidase